MNVLRLKETMLKNKIEFLEKTVFFLVRPETYWGMCQGPNETIKVRPSWQNQNWTLVCHIWTT